LTSKPSKLQPALVGGLIVGLGSSIPLLEAANLCCCFWSLAGGAVAARMLVTRSPLFKVTSGEGAVVGLLAGLVGAGINLIISVPLKVLTWSSSLQSSQSMFDSFDDPAMRALGAQAINMMQDHPVLFALLGWLLFAFAGSGFAALGGVLGVAFFEKRKNSEQPAPPEPPPPPQPPLPFDATPEDRG
jgi:hypothetical protein